MSEKLLVCDALDERDFLRKKIISAISNAKFVGSKRIRDTKVDGISDVESFNKAATSDFQSIQSNIDRYNRLDTAITLANAMTEIELRSGTKMTRAAAITLKKVIANQGSIDFTRQLIGVLMKQYEEAVSQVQAFNKKADAETENYKTSLVGKEGSNNLNESSITVLKELTANLYGELVDPLNVETKIKELKDSYETLRKELDSAIKISNATTFVEF